MKLAVGVAILFLASAPAASAAEVNIRLYPPRPLIERTRLGQAINFDFEPLNSGTRTLELRAIKAAIRDPSGLIVQRLEVNDNGGLPGIQTIPTRIWKPGEAHTIFNPFHTLAADIPIGRIDFELLFKDEKGQPVTEPVTVRPVPYRQRTRLIFPMPGRVLVWDGHDFYGHHRRWDFSHPSLKQMGILTNPGRYSFDFVVVDADGRHHSGTGDKREDHLSFGSPLIAPAAGTIVAMANDASNEPSEPTRASFAADPMKAIYGNYVVIDHGNGEFSQLGHLKQGSVTVKVGEQVRQGQVVGAAGASGTSLFPHLHYQLVTRPGIDGEGLPARFDGITRMLGAQRKREDDSWIDSGDIVESSR